MHSQQRQTSLFLRLSNTKDNCRSSIGRNRSSNGRKNDSSSILSNDYPCLLSIIMRWCFSIRTRASSSSSSASAPSSKCSSTSTTLTSCYSVLLTGVLAWSVTFLLILSCLGIVGAEYVTTNQLSVEDFRQIQCNGTYDVSMFARLDRLCEDCYNLFREPKVYMRCRYFHIFSDFFFIHFKS